MKNENKKNPSGLWLKRIAVAACAAILVTALAVSPQVRAYTASIAESLGIKIFRLSDDELNKLKNNSESVDIDKMEDGQSKNINGITIEKSGQTVDQSSGAVLTEKLDNGVGLDKTIDSFQLTEEQKNSIKENSGK